MEWLKNKFTTTTEPEKENNFPPFIPFLRLSISDCEGAKKFLFFMALANMVATYILIILNFLAAVATCIVGFIYSNGAPFLVEAVVALIFILLGTFVIFFGQFYTVYMACSSKLSLKYIIAMATQVFWVIFFLLQVAGVPHVGGVGIASGIWSLLSDTTNWQLWPLAVVHFVFAIVWLIMAVYQIILLIILIKFFKSDGGSVSAARNSAILNTAASRIVSL